LPRHSLPDTARFIQENLPVLPAPGVSEIILHKATPGSGLHRLLGPDSPPPYWAHWWGGGLALARYVLDHPQCVHGQRVLDLGSGSGIVAIAAAMAGASEVHAAETDAIALTAIRLNATANAAVISAFHGDVTAGEPMPVDVVLVGDLFYERALAKRVNAYLDRCLETGIHVLIGDPLRAHLPRTRLQPLAEYRVADFGSGEENRPAAVFALQRETAS